MGHWDVEEPDAPTLPRQMVPQHGASCIGTRSDAKIIRGTLTVPELKMTCLTRQLSTEQRSPSACGVRRPVSAHRAGEKAFAFEVPEIWKIPRSHPVPQQRW